MSLAKRLLPPCAASLVLCASVAQAEPRKPTHIACVGDSITAGAGASVAEKNYVSQLQALLGGGVQVKNFGKSGATALRSGYGDKPYDLQPEYTAATDFVSGAGEQAVVSVIIMLGTNDSKPFNWEPVNKPKNDQQFKTDYLTLVDHFLGLPTKPVVYVAYPLATGNNPCCSIRGDVIHDQELPLIQEVATLRGLPLIDLNTDTLNHPEYFGDGVHPNDAGYLVMANLVKKGLEREPTVSISSPAGGASLAAGGFTLTALASGGTVKISSVEFFDGTTSLGKVTTSPFMFNWSAVVGPHTLSATATDATLATASASVSILVRDSLPSDTGGATSGGAPTAGMPAAAGTAPAAGAPTGAGGGQSTSGAGTTSSAGAAPTPAAPVATESGCGCSVPGSRGIGPSWLLLASALLGLRRRRAA